MRYANCGRPQANPENKEGELAFIGEMRGGGACYNQRVHWGKPGVQSVEVGLAAVVSDWLGCH